VEQGQTAEKQEAMSVCLARALEAIREMVRPMGGYVAEPVKMSTGSRYGLSLEIAIGFEADALTQYISRFSPQAQCTAGKSGDQQAC